MAAKRTEHFHPPGNELVGKQELIEWTGLTLTEERLRQLAHKGYFAPAVRGKYRFQETVIGLMRYYAEGSSKTSERMRVVRLEREQVKLENEKIEGAKNADKLIYRDAGIRAVSRFVIRLKFLQFALPKNLSARLAIETEALACEELLIKALRDSYLKVKDEFTLGKPKFECPQCKKRMPI